MPVSELAWVPSSTPGRIVPEFIETGREAVEVQSKWIATHAPSLGTGPASKRGAALYQQREDRGIMLVTAHWDSPAQHTECISTEENKQAMAKMGPYMDASRIKIMHVGDVSLFSEEKLEAPVLTVLRIGVVGREKKEFEERVKGMSLDGGWRVEKDELDEGREEFVAVGTWDDEDVVVQFFEREWKDVWRDIVLDCEVRSYTRLV